MLSVADPLVLSLGEPVCELLGLLGDFVEVLHAHHARTATAASRPTAGM
jgi:hypothetical protein